MDDLGLFLTRSLGADSFARLKRGFGGVLLRAAPYLMKSLTVAGTVAMFLVGGGILTHGLPPVHHLLEQLAHSLGPLGGLATMLANALFGVVAGAVVVLGVKLIGALRAKSKPAA
jgi:predicted DNA repair protein MutK